MRRAAALGLLAVLGSLVLARAGQADTAPSVWDVARDPVERERWSLHVRVLRLLHPPAPDDVFLPELRRDEELRLEAARTMLEQAEAASSPDVRLRFDLGIVYEQLATREGRDDLHRRAVAVLAPAVDAAPEHPAATEALESLVYAYAKLDRPGDELDTWRRYIPRLADERARATPMMNMGEAEMRLGHLDDALATFRAVLQICGGMSNSSGRNSTYALALWDLAVALDRAGDARGAVETAGQAMQMRWAEVSPPGLMHDVTGWDAIRDQQSVFFVPGWEREWYLALGYAAAAREDHDVRASGSLWAQAEDHWGTYITRASADRREDRWLAIAKVRRDRARAERLAAHARAASKPPAPPRKDEASGEERQL